MLESIKNLSDLTTAIATINVKDYGDFKRKAVLYLNRYSELKNLKGAEKVAFDELVDRIQYHTNHDIEKTRNWSLQQLKKLS